MKEKIHEIDITGAARALAAMDHVQAVARVVVLLGVPATVFVILGEIHARNPLENRFILWGVMSLPLMLLSLLGFSFAIATMRPLVGIGVLTLSVGPALWALLQYTTGIGPFHREWREQGSVLLVLFVFAFPLLLAWWRVAGLSPELRNLARPAPRLPDFPSFWRETFSIWPGVRQRWSRAAISTLFSYLSTLILWVGVIIVTPVAILVFLLLPLLAATKGFVDVVGPVIIVLIVLQALLFLQNLMRKLARWSSRAALADKVEEDDRPPILFLRSFQDDQVELPERDRLAELYRRMINLGTGRKRLDHILVENFSRIGPALALGTPGEKNLPFGAARVYASHEDWKEVVTDLAHRSNHVVLVADSTPGVEWEVSTLLEPPLLDKTLFVCAPKAVDIRANGILGQWLIRQGCPQGNVPIVGVFRDTRGELVLLRSRHPRSSQAFIVALQAFFRMRTDPASESSE